MILVPLAKHQYVPTTSQPMHDLTHDKLPHSFPEERLS